MGVIQKYRLEDTRRGVGDIGGWAVAGEPLSRFRPRQSWHKADYPGHSGPTECAGHAAEEPLGPKP